MFKQARALFLYCVSPVHMGAGVAVGGLIDNPIQREKHTGHPLFAGSGIKGALRHRFTMEGVESVETIFGPEKSASDHAGAVSFSDAQLVAFPVRSLKGGYVYITSPFALARVRRQMESAGVSLEWSVPEVKSDQAVVTNSDLLSDDHLTLESFQFTVASADTSNMLEEIAGWLATNGLPDDEGSRFFREKLSSDLVLLSDTDFGYFVQNATSVEPHVKIDIDTGTAKDGGLFYTENLPPESLLMTTLMASDGRGKEKVSAAEVIAEVVDGVDGKLLQLGGDSTTGRGQILPHFVAVGGEDQ